MPLRDYTTPRKKKRGPGFWDAFAASVGNELVRRQRLKEAFTQMQKEQEMALQKNKQLAELQATLQRETDRIRSGQDIQEVQGKWDIERFGTPVTEKSILDMSTTGKMPDFIETYIQNEMDQGQVPSVTPTVFRQQYLQRQSPKPSPMQTAQQKWDIQHFGEPITEDYILGLSQTGKMPNFVESYITQQMEQGQVPAVTPERFRQLYIEAEQGRKSQQMTAKTQRDAAEAERQAADEGRKQKKFEWEEAKQTPEAQAKKATEKQQEQARKAADDIYQKIIVAAGDRADSTTYAAAAAAADTVLAKHGQPPKYGTGAQRETAAPPAPPSSEVRALQSEAATLMAKGRATLTPDELRRLATIQARLKQLGL